MNKFTPTDISRMERFAESTMQCKVIIGSWAPTRNALNEIIPGWTDEPVATECGVSFDPGIKTYGAESTTVRFDASFRFSKQDAPSDIRQRLKLTEMYGETLAVPLVFVIASPIEPGISSVLVLARRVTL